MRNKLKFSSSLIEKTHFDKRREEECDRVLKRRSEFVSPYQIENRPNR
ncbi:hypothetical protein CKA32_005819 [Geitlerinema sp. FC II]|nr:hypothetical protein CKA32_005819 [Geitlerinema sp. FC II]